MPNFCIGGVLFETSGNGLLQKISLHHLCDTIEIPCTTPYGETISSIGRDCFKRSGSCNKLILPPTVSVVHKDAFYDSAVKEVVWSSGCSTIPKGCFYNSLIERISNIDHVAVIGDFAFTSSCIKDFVWPNKCRTIPTGCFSNSKLESISNICHVLEISALAFESLKYTGKLNLSEIIFCSVDQRAFRHSPKDNIIFPYYISEEELNSFE